MGPTFILFRALAKSKKGDSVYFFSSVFPSPVSGWGSLIRRCLSQCFGCHPRPAYGCHSLGVYACSGVSFLQRLRDGLRGQGRILGNSISQEKGSGKAKNPSADASREQLFRKLMRYLPFSHRDRGRIVDSPRAENGKTRGNARAVFPNLTGCKVFSIPFRNECHTLD